jgi:hypothetical protein
MADKKDVRQFVDFLTERGLTQQELSDKLNELAAAVIETGKKGELVLKITMKAAGEDMVVVTDDVVLKAPKPDRASAIYFADENNNLHRNNPAQASFDDLREVAQPNNIKEIG